MSERFSSLFSNGSVSASTAPRASQPHRTVYSLSALMFVAAYGCASQGTQIGGGSGGSTSAGTGGDSGGAATGGSSSGSGGGTVAGTGGSDATGSGGSNGAGTGGASSGSGGSTTTGSGGGSATSSGGSTAAGTGGATTGATGGTTATGTGGSTTLGTGGATPPRTGGTTGSAGATGSGGAVAETCPLPGGICHEFFANDNSRNRIVYVNQFKQAAPIWYAPVGDTGVNSPRTIEIVNQPLAPSGKALLVSINRGYAEFDLASGMPVPGARVQNRTGVTGAARVGTTPNTALGTQTAIVTVNPTGAVVSMFTLPNPSDELRAINRNPIDGSFWFSKIDDIFQVTATGTMRWNANLGAGTKGYAVWWRGMGMDEGAYATTGDPSTVVELDHAKTIVKRVGGKAKFPELDFFSGFVRLPNGNFVVANWLGHISNTADLNRPHVVELTPQDTIVWRWGTQAEARQITNVYVVR